jgi:hypothetical protein
MINDWVDISLREGVSAGASGFARVVRGRAAATAAQVAAAAA